MKIVEFLEKPNHIQNHKSEISKLKTTIPLVYQEKTEDNLVTSVSWCLSRKALDDLLTLGDDVVVESILEKLVDNYIADPAPTMKKFLEQNPQELKVDFAYRPSGVENLYYIDLHILEGGDI